MVDFGHKWVKVDGTGCNWSNEGAQMSYLCHVFRQRLAHHIINILNLKYYARIQQARECKLNCVKLQ